MRNAIVLKEIDTALNTRIFCYFGIAICQALLSYFFFLPCVFIVESCDGGSGDKGPVRKKV